MVEIRKVTGGDEKNLAYIQTESWKAAFRSILPPEMLDRCTNFSKAEAMYRKLLEEKKGNGYILEIDHRPHCIAWWDAAREEAMAGYAELICIHSLPENWHCGYGSKMMDAVLADVAKAGYTKILLWVFEQNAPAIAFYSKVRLCRQRKKAACLRSGRGNVCEDAVIASDDLRNTKLKRRMPPPIVICSPSRGQ